MTTTEAENLKEAADKPTDNIPENEDEKADRENGEKTEEDKKETPKDEWQDLLGSGSIMRKILKQGEPDTRPVRLQKCILNYELTCEGKVVEKKEYFEMQLGDCEVIQGLEVAVGLMDTNERSLIKIEPRLAFSSIGSPPEIPPNATVCYDVELVSVSEADDPEVLTIQERKEIGNKKRERGNWWYGRGENTLAIQCYRRALDYLDEVEGGIKDPSKATDEEITDSALQELMEDRINVCNNMAAAQIKLELYDAALTSITTVLRCQPNNVKALFRKAKIYRAKNDLNAALKCLKKANEVSPNNVDVQKEIGQINNLIQKQKVTERELAKRMFGGESNSSLPPPPSSTGAKKKDPKHNFLLWSATIAASVAVCLVGVAAYRLKFA